ncbi:MAG: N-acetylmuramoyl-L-alanine amidase-like domain-containing protein [Brevinematia bacterium]
MIFILSNPFLNVLIRCSFLFSFLLFPNFVFPIGDDIVKYAKMFIGTPYDTDPLGAYVRNKVVVYDKEVDCMYLVFRSVELAFGNGDEDKSIDVALDKRFKTKGILSNGFVVNYEERFEYGEDMFLSDKWGKLVFTNTILLDKIFSERLNRYVSYVPKRNFKNVAKDIKNGSIVFFIKDPSKSKKGEVVGHLGVIESDGYNIFLIHASGSKNRGGKVVREKFQDYLKRSSYVGFVITSFDM